MSVLARITQGRIKGGVIARITFGKIAKAFGKVIFSGKSILNRLNVFTQEASNIASCNINLQSITQAIKTDFILKNLSTCNIMVNNYKIVNQNNLIKINRDESINTNQDYIDSIDIDNEDVLDINNLYEINFK